jgi:hypothetical protein
MPQAAMLIHHTLARFMNYLYSLYDALVSISVPSDKARAVVDAMERDMGTTLATKQDLESLRVATKQDLESLRVATKQDLESLRVATTQDLLLLKQEMVSRFALQSQEIATLRAAVAGDMATLGLRITVRLGSMLVVSVGLILAAMRLWT